jgi:hypothetical protein
MSGPAAVGSDSRRVFNRGLGANIRWSVRWMLRTRRRPVSTPGGTDYCSWWVVSHLASSRPLSISRVSARASCVTRGEHGDASSPPCRRRKRGFGSYLESRAKAVARLDLEVSAGWATPLQPASRAGWKPKPLLLPTVLSRVRSVATCIIPNHHDGARFLPVACAGGGVVTIVRRKLRGQLRWE